MSATTGGKDVALSRTPSDYNSIMSDSGRESDSPTSYLGKLMQYLRKATKGTVLSSIFILLTTCIGAGTLSLPYAFAQGGVFVFSIIFFIIMLMAVYVGIMLLHSKECCTEVYPSLEVWSYEDLAYASFGIVGRIMSLLTIAALLFLALIAYMIYTRDQLAAVMNFIVTREGIGGCTPLLNCGVLMCIAFIPIFPITLLRKLTPLQFTSYLSIFSIVLVAIFITAKTIILHSNGTVQSDQHVSLAPLKFESVITVISYCGLSFICHFNLLPLQKELTGRPSRAKMYFIIVGAILTAYAIYNLVIFSAYFSFYGSILSDVMLNYGKKDALMTVARLFLFVTILMHYPVLLHPTRSNINGAIYLIYKLISDCCSKRRKTLQVQDNERKPILNDESDSQDKDKRYDLEFKVPLIPWFLETAALFCATFIIATFINDVGKVWNFVGSTAGVLVLYVYPAAFYLRLRYVVHKKRARASGVSLFSLYGRWDVAKEGVAWVMLVIGLILLVLENYQAIDAVVDTGGGSSNATNATRSSFCYMFCKNAMNTTNAMNATEPSFYMYEDEW